MAVETTPLIRVKELRQRHVQFGQHSAPTIQQLAQQSQLTLPENFVQYWRQFYASSPDQQNTIKADDPETFQTNCKLLWRLLEESKKESL